MKPSQYPKAQKPPLPCCHLLIFWLSFISLMHVWRTLAVLLAVWPIALPASGAIISDCSSLGAGWFEAVAYTSSSGYSDWSGASVRAFQYGATTTIILLQYSCVAFFFFFGFLPLSFTPPSFLSFVSLSLVHLHHQNPFFSSHVQLD